jgi:hypothetical protein
MKGIYVMREVLAPMFLEIEVLGVAHEYFSFRI